MISNRRHIANFFNRTTTRDGRGQPVETWTLVTSIMCEMNIEEADATGRDRDITERTARITLRPVFYNVNTTSRVIINGVNYNINRITELKRTLWQMDLTQVSE